MGIPVICEKCGSLFTMGGLFGSGVVTLTDVRTNCPACGGTTLLADGTYEIADDVFKSVTGLSAASLARFQATLSAAPSAEQVVDEAKSISQAFGRTIAILQALGGLPLVIAMIALYLQFAAAQEDGADNEALISELKASTARQEQLLESLREVIAARDTPAPQTYSPQTPATSRNQPTEASGQDRGAKRRAWKEEKKASKDNSIKFR